MTTVVVSPHTDDAIFSIGAHLSTLDPGEPLTIASPMAGIPNDAVGLVKHITLRREHDRAVALLAPTARVVNGDFLDDVYDPPALDELSAWLREAISGADTVYVPVGIHHPDHLMVSDAMVALVATVASVWFYEELPYRVLYPRLLNERLVALGLVDIHTVWPNAVKADAVRCYDSQVDDELITKLLVPEHIWRLW